MTKYVLALLIKSNVITVKKLSKLKKTLKQHKSKCKWERKYKCQDCDDIFYIYGQLVDHKKRNHSRITCDICETETYNENIKCHMKNLHAGFTPRSTLAWMQMQQEKKDQ